MVKNNFKRKTSVFLSAIVMFSSAISYAGATKGYEKPNVTTDSISKKITEKNNFSLTDKYLIGSTFILAACGFIAKKYFPFGFENNADQYVSSEFLKFFTTHRSSVLYVNETYVKNYIEKLGINSINNINIKIIKEEIIKAASSNVLNILFSSDKNVGNTYMIDLFHSSLLSLYFKILQNSAIKEIQKTEIQKTETQKEEIEKKEKIEEELNKLKEELSKLIGFKTTKTFGDGIGAVEYISCTDNVDITSEEAEEMCISSLDKNIESLYGHKKNINMLTNFASLIFKDFKDKKISEINFKPLTPHTGEETFNEREIKIIIGHINAVAGTELTNKVKLLALIKASTYPAGKEILKNNESFSDCLKNKLPLYDNFVLNLLEEGWPAILDAFLRLS
ncbi:MAG: hypothetical protein FWC41_12600 [Firmicutes bacterium]|nr:hypothetical protein [Bacillota bacterium]